jgi:hypothetical protein
VILALFLNNDIIKSIFEWGFSMSYSDRKKKVSKVFEQIAVKKN